MYNLRLFSDFEKAANQEQRIQRKLLGFYEEHIVSQNNYEKIRLVGSQRQWLYGLPEIHKHNIPLRPIYLWSALPNITLPCGWQTN